VDSRRTRRSLSDRRGHSRMPTCNEGLYPKGAIHARTMPQRKISARAESTIQECRSRMQIKNYGAKPKSSENRRHGTDPPSLSRGLHFLGSRTKLGGCANDAQCFVLLLPSWETRPGPRVGVRSNSAQESSRRAAEAQRKWPLDPADDPGQGPTKFHKPCSDRVHSGQCLCSAFMRLC
jgi:hypothetical protein